MGTTFCSCEDRENGDIQLCQARIPPSLRKACLDEFLYALQLRDGTVLLFNFAECHGDWVHLTLAVDHGGNAGGQPLAFPCPRGVDIRLSEIVWCADAPWGS